MLGHPVKIRRPRRSGGGLLAPIVAASLLVLGLGTAGSAWFAGRAVRVGEESARAAEVRALGAGIGHGAEALLASGDLAALRALVAAVSDQFELRTCRVVLADGSVVAAANPAWITAHVLPDKWPVTGSAPADARPASTVGAEVALKVDGRGAAWVVLDAAVAHRRHALLQVLVPIAGVGLGGLLVLVLAVHRLAGPLRRMARIRDALLALDGQAPPAESAEQVEGEGAEVVAWNRLIEERVRLRRGSVAERTIQSLLSQTRTSADLDSACDAMWQGLIVVDPQMRAKYVNGAAAVLLQVRPEQLVGGELGQFVHDQRVLDAVRGALDGTCRQRKTFELERREKDEGGMLRISVRPVRRDDPTAAIVVIEDITQLRAADDARQSFVAHATHELRTPLTNIRLYAEALLENGEQDPAQRAKAINVINQESRRLERIVSDMLSVSEIEAGSLTLVRDDVHLGELLGDVESDFQAQAREKGITLAFGLPPKLPVLHGDRDKIMLAVHNLVGNALKYTPAGGRVQVNVEADEAQVSIAVKDNGIGISEEDQAHLFERFYRAKDQRVAAVTGSGLGLALAREVIRLHGGDIGVQSRLDHGSTFTIRVPVRAEAA